MSIVGIVRRLGLMVFGGRVFCSRGVRDAEDVGIYRFSRIGWLGAEGRR